MEATSVSLATERGSEEGEWDAGSLTVMSNGSDIAGDLLLRKLSFLLELSIMTASDRELERRRTRR